MTTETISSSPPTTDLIQTISVSDLLLQHLKQKGYKLLKDDAPIIAEKKEEILAVTRHGKKELIDIKGLPAFLHVNESREWHQTKTDQLLHAVQSIAESLFFSFINFGKYFKGEKITSALALPDSERYHQILEKLEDYFTENNLDFKIYLVAEDGQVQERNLNQKKNDLEVPKEVVEKRKALRLK